MWRTKTTMSCGVAQVDELSHYNHRTGPLKSFESAVRNCYKSDRVAFVLFSDADFLGRGRQLAKALKEKYPRSVKESPVRVNPNTGNKIRVWIWTVPDGFYSRKRRKRHTVRETDAQEELGHE